jgi:hypothetical protein
VYIDAASWRLVIFIRLKSMCCGAEGEAGTAFVRVISSAESISKHYGQPRGGPCPKLV